MKNKFYIWILEYCQSADELKGIMRTMFTWYFVTTVVFIPLALDYNSFTLDFFLAYIKIIFGIFLFCFFITYIVEVILKMRKLDFFDCLGSCLIIISSNSVYYYFFKYYGSKYMTNGNFLENMLIPSFWCFAATLLTFGVIKVIQKVTNKILQNKEFKSDV